jgi:hypothetical protein
VLATLRIYLLVGSTQPPLCHCDNVEVLPVTFCQDVLASRSRNVAEAMLLLGSKVLSLLS